MRKFLKREPVPPRAFVADGTSRGVVTIADTIGFRNGASVVIRAGSLGATGKVQAVISTTQMIVETELQQFLDLSQFTVLAGSTIEQMEEQFSPTIEDGELFSSVYESHPVTAIRTTSVDPYGRPYTPDNPLPVTGGGGGLAPNNYDDVKIIKNSCGDPIQYQFYLNNVSVGNIDVFYDMFGAAEYKKA